MLTVATAYEVFLAIPEKDKQDFLALVNSYKIKPTLSLEKNDSKPKFTKEEAIDFLLKTVFTSKRNIKKTRVICLD